jgi:hypothetical protein
VRNLQKNSAFTSLFSFSARKNRTSAIVFQLSSITTIAVYRCKLFLHAALISESTSYLLARLTASDRTIFSNLFQRTLNSDQSGESQSPRVEQRLQMRKCAHNMGIANMRAGRKINHRRIAIRRHRLVGRSKKHQVNQRSFIFIKKTLAGRDGILISAHQQYFFVVRHTNSLLQIAHQFSQ